MKRKDESESRKEIDMETQKSVERKHWTLEGSESKLPDSKLKFIIEYDNTGGIGIDGPVRQSFKNFNKEPEVESDKSAGPLNKIPKLTSSENKRKNK